MPGGKLACPGLAAVPFSPTLGGCGKNQGSAAFYWAVGNLVINGNCEWRKTKAGLVGPGLPESSVPLGRWACHSSEGDGGGYSLLPLCLSHREAGEVSTSGVITAALPRS